MVIDMGYWTKVIRKLTALVFTIIVVFFTFKLAVFYMPFLIAFILSLLIEPVIRWLMKKTNLKRKTSAILILGLVISIIIGFLTWGIISLISESSNLLQNFNVYVEKANNLLQGFINSIDLNRIKIPEEIMNIANNSFNEFLQTFSIWAKELLTSILNAITSIPTIIIYIVISLLSLYFICTDKIYMLDQLEHHFPERWIKKLNIHIKELTKVLGGYLKAEATLVLVSFIISIIGLYFLKFMKFNIPFPLLAALIIAFVDALPIFGSGTVMIPWAIICGLDGDIRLGIAILILWIIMSIVRQFIEPRVVSKNIGIHPIFTLIAMYTGFKIIGIIGMLIGPIILIILKNIFGTFIDRGVVKSILE